MALLDDLKPITPTIRVGDGVQYEGSLTDRHGFYRVSAIVEGQLVLGRQGHRVLRSVRPSSAFRRDVCTTCDAAPVWNRAVIFPHDKADRACIDCARQIEATPEYKAWLVGQRAEWQARQAAAPKYV